MAISKDGSTLAVARFPLLKEIGVFWLIEHEIGVDWKQIGGTAKVGTNFSFLRLSEDRDVLEHESGGVDCKQIGGTAEAGTYFTFLRLSDDGDILAISSPMNGDITQNAGRMDAFWFKEENDSWGQVRY